MCGKSPGTPETSWELVHTIRHAAGEAGPDVAMGHHWTSTKTDEPLHDVPTCVAHGVDEDGTAVIVSPSQDAATVRRPGGH